MQVFQLRKVRDKEIFPQSIAFGRSLSGGSFVHTSEGTTPNTPGFMLCWAHVGDPALQWHTKSFMSETRDILRRPTIFEIGLLVNTVQKSVVSGLKEKRRNADFMGTLQRFSAL